MEFGFPCRDRDRYVTSRVIDLCRVHVRVHVAECPEKWQNAVHYARVQAR
jgi:hypothetical protein